MSKPEEQSKAAKTDERAEDEMKHLLTYEQMVECAEGVEELEEALAFSRLLDKAFENRSKLTEEDLEDCGSFKVEL